MTQFFIQLLNASIAASWLIGAVLLVRLIIKGRSPRWIACLLWGLVALRLVVPFSVESPLSLVPETPEITLEFSEEAPSETESIPAPPVSEMGNASRPTEDSSETEESEPFVPSEEPSSELSAEPSSEPSAEPSSEPSEEPSFEPSREPSSEPSEEPDESEEPEESSEEESQEISQESSQESSEESEEESTHESSEESIPTGMMGTTSTPGNPSQGSGISFAALASGIWLAGVLALAGYALVNYFLLKQRVLVFVPDERGFRRCEGIDTPFVLGFFRPRIYLPYGLSPASEPYIIAHEKAHIKRMDHLVKPIAYCILALHWFNPLVWLAFVLFCKDIEYACDEKVLKNAAADIRKEYATALLECASKRSFLAACPIAFGEVSVKERVKKTMNYKRPLLWVIIVSVLLCALVAVFFFTSPMNEESAPATSSEESVPEVSSEAVSEDVSLEESMDTSDEESSSLSDLLNKYSEEGFVFDLNKEGDGYIFCGVGTCEATEIVVPSEFEGLPVVEIGPCAFQATDVTSVVIPDSVTKIGDFAFRACKQLRTVTMPAVRRDFGISNSIYEDERNIGVFDGCTDLTLTITAGSFRRIYEGAFRNRPEIVSVILKGNFIALEYEAFAGCTELKRFTVDGDVSSFWSSAFAGCTALEQFIIGDQATSLEYLTFERCTALQSIEIGSGLCSLNGFAFKECSQPKSVTVSKENQFFYSKDNCLIETASGRLVLGHNGSAASDGVLVIPDGVVIIGSDTFRDRPEIKKLVLPDSVEILERCAFSGCTGIEEIVFSKNLKLIDEYALYGCTGLTSLELPDSLETVGISALSGCDGLTEIVFPKNLKTIAEDAFYRNPNLKKVTFGDELVRIGHNAFEGCTALQSITIPGSVKEIERGAFLGCTGLTQVVLEEGVRRIGREAFSGCTNLETVTVPDSLTFIGEDAFRGCVKLQNFRIPAGMKTIDYSAFSGCTGIAYIVLPETLGEICPGSFDGWTSKQIVYVESYTIPLLWLISEEHFGNATVYWAGEWEYVEGVPTPKVEK